MRVGAVALGLNITWRYHFVGPGTRLEATRDAVALDVGGQLCAGVLDQHQDGALGASTSELLLRFPELVYGHLMNGWLERRDDGQDLKGRLFAPTIVTHAAPDFDAMVSAWLVKQLVEQGQYPPCAAALVEYSTQVDQGREKLELTLGPLVTDALHLAYLGIMHLEERRDLVMLERGFRLLEVVLAAIIKRKKAPFKVYTSDLVPTAQGPLGEWRKFDEFQDVSVALKDDLLTYQNVDKRGADLTKVCLVPAADHGEPIAVKVFIARAPTQSKLNKYWVRADGFPYFICPYGTSPPQPTGSTAQRFPRVILSLDPTFRDNGRRPTLKGLGFRLEKAETEKRNEGGLQDTRGLPPRYDDGTCDNADPWYDGRGHEHTIVDAPRAGTVLDYEEVIGLALSEFWHVRLVDATVFVALPIEARPVSELFGPGKVVTVPKTPKRVSGSLHEWYGESKEVVGHRSLPVGACPPGFKTSSHVIRRFPGGTECTLRLLEFTFAAKEGAAATVEGLTRWLDQKSDEKGGQIYVMARIRVEEGSQVIADLDALQARLCLGGVTDAPTQSGGQLILYNRRAIAIRPITGQAAPTTTERDALLREMLLYAAFQAETLNAYLGRVLEAVRPGHIKQATDLQRDFLEFHARFVHEDVVQEDDVGAVYIGLRDAMSLPARHKKVSKELERLEQLERDEGEGIKDYILFGIGLTGVIQAWYSVTLPLSTGDVGLFAGAVPFILVLYAGRRRLTRLITRGPARQRTGSDLTHYGQHTKPGGS